MIQHIESLRQHLQPQPLGQGERSAHADVQREEIISDSGIAAQEITVNNRSPRCSLDSGYAGSDVQWEG